MSEIIFLESSSQFAVQELDFICGNCDDSFATREELNRHLERRHSEVYRLVVEGQEKSRKVVGNLESRYICKCLREFETFSELVSHVIEVHPDEMIGVSFETQQEDDSLETVEEIEEETVEECEEVYER